MPFTRGDDEIVENITDRLVNYDAKHLVKRLASINISRRMCRKQNCSRALNRDARHKATLDNAHVFAQQSINKDTARHDTYAPKNPDNMGSIPSDEISDLSILNFVRAIPAISTNHGYRVDAIKAINNGLRYEAKITVIHIEKLVGKIAPQLGQHTVDVTIVDPSSTSEFRDIPRSATKGTAAM